ncbi:MAG: nuclear transport factor 2 family protein [Terriglobales bacterium]
MAFPLREDSTSVQFCCGLLLQPSRGGTAVTRDEAWSLANHWVAAWNAHDLDLIMTHYDDAIELISPVAARLLGTPDGKVAGKLNLRAYFQRGLEAYPELQFGLEDVFWGMNSIVLYYVNQKGTHTAEFMELSADGKVLRVVANYSSLQPGQARAHIPA